MGLINSIPMPASVMRILEPPERIAMSAYARDRFLIREYGAIRPGPYDVTLTPYWVEPMDTMSDPTVREVDVVACAQSGKSQFLAVALSFFVKTEPGNILYIRPTQPDVVEAFRDRFIPMINANLADQMPEGVDPANLSDNPAIRLAGSIIYGAAASTPGQITSRTTPKVFFDEVDNCEAAHGALGNTVQLARERMAAVGTWNQKLLMCGTLSLESGSLYQNYTENGGGDYWEPCPRCGVYQPLILERIKSEIKDPKLIRLDATAWYECASCKARIPQSEQGWMADRGVHIHDGQKVSEVLPLDNPDIVDRAVTWHSNRWWPCVEGAYPRERIAFRVWRANCKFDSCSWSNILATFLEVKDDPEKLRVFMNAWLAMPWRDTKPGIAEEDLRAHAGTLARGVVPSEAVLLLAGVDVQADCIFYVVRAWGPRQQSWAIDCGSVAVLGEDYVTAIGNLHRRLCVEGYTRTDGMAQRVFLMAVDSGYRAKDVYDACKAAGSGIIPTKGREKSLGIVKKSEVDGRPLYILNTGALKNRLSHLTRVDAGGIGYFSTASDMPAEYYKHMTSEHRTKKGAFEVWTVKTPGRPNHYWDCEVYALAAGFILEAIGEASLSGINDQSRPVAVSYQRERAEVAQAPKPRPAPKWGFVGKSGY